jgi:hypothetical protein
MVVFESADHVFHPPDPDPSEKKMKFTGYSSLFLCVGVLWLAVLGGFSANADNLRENKSNGGGVVAAAPVLEHALDTAASAGHAVLAAIGHVFEGIVEAEESGKPLPVRFFLYLYLFFYRTFVQHLRFCFVFCRSWKASRR